jgi:hypothetical protein
MSNSTTTYSVLMAFRPSTLFLDCTKTHWLTTYFSQTAITSHSVYDEVDLDSQCKNHDTSYVPNIVIIALLPPVWEVPGSNLSMRTAMLTSSFRIVPPPQKVNTSTVSQHRSQLFPNTSFAVALISYGTQKGISNMELSTSWRTARLVTMQKLCSPLYSKQSCVNTD